MGSYSPQQSIKSSSKEQSSSLSLMPLHFEYDKKITEVRAALNAKQPRNDK